MCSPRPRLRALILSLGLLLAAGPPAQAAPITFDFGGTVTSVDPALAGSFAVSQSLTGSFTYESTSLPSSPGGGNYFTALTALSFTVGTYSASFLGPLPPPSQDLKISVINLPGLDIFNVSAVTTDGLTGPPAAGFAFSGFFFSLQDNTGTVFSSTALPTSLSLSSFDFPVFTLEFLDLDDNEFAVEGTVTSLTLVPPTGGGNGGNGGAPPIPEPSTVVLLGSGLAGLAVWKRRRA